MFQKTQEVEVVIYKDGSGDTGQGVQKNIRGIVGTVADEDVSRDPGQQG